MEVFILCYSIFCLFSNLLAEEWTHSKVLDDDGRYHLSWKTPEVINDDSEIIFQVEVEAHGYIGFGLSPTGDMIGADIVTGWVKGHKIYFQDRHSKGFFLPEIDKSEDWYLTEGYENDTHTILKFWRKLDTCDEEDMTIDDSTMRIIYAFSEEDPEYDDPMYHYENRGSKSVMLLQPKLLQIDDSQFLQWDARSPNITVPPGTTYWCKIYKAPELSSKHHIVKVKPVIDKNHEKLLHHMDLFECIGATPGEYDPYVSSQGEPCPPYAEMPDSIKKCEGIFTAWGRGGEELVLPEHLGFPFYPEHYYRLEVHYDNIENKEGIIDSSGFRLFYTPKLRQFDVGWLMVGSSVISRSFVPPGQKEYTSAGHSNPDCLNPVMPDDGIKVIGVIFHSHVITKKVIARHFRRNLSDPELPALAKDKTYDPMLQECKFLRNEATVLPVDQVTVECTYDSSHRSYTTFGGRRSIEDEMCVAFLLHYPRISRYASFSAPTLNVINAALNTSLHEDHELYETFADFDWDSVDVRDVEFLTRFSKHNSQCFLGNGVKNTVESLVSYPKNIKHNPWITKSKCKTRIREKIANIISLMDIIS